jgi:hypothetical protein
LLGCIGIGIGAGTGIGGLSGRGATAGRIACGLVEPEVLLEAVLSLEGE